MTLCLFESLVDLEEQLRIPPAKIQNVLSCDKPNGAMGYGRHRETVRFRQRRREELARAVEAEEKAFPFPYAHGAPRSPVAKDDPARGGSPLVDDRPSPLETDPLDA